MKELINNVSVDCVIFGFHDRTLSIMLTKRELRDPASDEFIICDYALPGNHLMVGENLNDAAIRVLYERTGLENIFLKQFHTFGDISRMENKKDWIWSSMHQPEVSAHVITVAFFALVESSIIKPDLDHQETKWFPAYKLPKLGFDHKKIVTMALEFLREEFRREPIGYELLPEKFTLTQLQNLYEAIFKTRLDKRNFRKKVMQMKYIIPLNEKLSEVGSKPAQLYIFSRDVYERTKKDRLDYTV
jgi:8-oxo-dGTP diphosphatase